MSTLFTFNNKLVMINNKLIEKVESPIPPIPPGPSFDEVTIGAQTWMAKNLSIDDGQGGIKSRTVNYGHGDVVEYYYNWNSAVRVAESINGWHLPTKTELQTLLNTVGAGNIPKLKSTYGWESGYNGTDQYGFGLFPAGTGDGGEGMAATLWTSTPKNEVNSYSIVFYYTNSYSIDGGSISSNFLSVRLIKDS